MIFVDIKSSNNSKLNSRVKDKVIGDRFRIIRAL
jgi:hypothetical protein